jgi:hypothetical protein
MFYVDLRLGKVLSDARVEQARSAARRRQQAESGRRRPERGQRADLVVSDGLRDHDEAEAA